MIEKLFFVWTVDVSQPTKIRSRRRVVVVVTVFIVVYIVVIYLFLCVSLCIFNDFRSSNPEKQIGPLRTSTSSSDRVPSSEG